VLGLSKENGAPTETIPAETADDAQPASPAGTGEAVEA
jgi:hypothetical protein